MAADNIGRDFEEFSPLRNYLETKSADDIVSFCEIFMGYMQKSYTWLLWDAANIVTGHCADEDFWRFRAWLVSMGRMAYEKIVQNPDYLCEYTDCDITDFEDNFTSSLADCVLDLYIDRVGQRPSSKYFPINPVGEHCDEDDYEVLEKRYPRLCEKYY